jgi:copper chaperone CopZ
MKKIMIVEGMHCGNCAKHVETALTGVSGVKGAKVDLKKKNVTLDLEETVTDDALFSAVKEAGYEPKSIEVKKGLFTR